MDRGVDPLKPMENNQAQASQPRASMCEDAMRRQAFAIFLLLAAPAGSVTPLAGPQLPGASGPEFQVSSSFPPRYSYYYRFGPAADLADTGDFIVVWATWQGGGLGAIVGRAFDSSGNPRAGEFELGDGAIFHYFPESPDVAAGAGQFVAVWTNYDSVIGGAVAYAVRAQRFNLRGQPEGPLLDLSPAGAPFYGEVAVEPGGDFIVVWESDIVARGRRFDSAGSPSWPEKSMGLGGQIPPDPDVAVDALGNFTVVWSRHTTTEPRAILARRFDSAGTLVDPTFAVSQFQSGLQRQPAIAARPDGGFVAVWRSIGQDGSQTGVFGRTFDGDLQPIGGEFLLNITTAAFQEKPDVGADDRGNFIAVWNSGTMYGRADRVMGQRFDAAGSRVGGEFQINEIFTTGQRLPTIGMRGDGEFLVTWYSTQSACCTGGTSVRARRFCATPNVSAPSSVSVCEGDSVDFDVLATGREPFSHQWRRDALPLFDDGRISGALTSSLSIDSAELYDAGLYDCLVTDACANPQSLVTTPAQLSIEQQPGQVTDLTIHVMDSGTLLRFTWAPAGVGAADYVVRADTAPGGSFSAVAGTMASPSTSLILPMPAGTQFYLVAGRNPTCGEGPLR